MEQLQLNDMVPGSIYSIDYDSYKYNDYIFLGKHFYRFDDAQYMFEKHKKKLYLWSPFTYKIYRKTKVRNRILKTILSSFLHEDMADVLSQELL